MLPAKKINMIPNWNPWRQLHICGYVLQWKCCLITWKPVVGHGFKPSVQTEDWLIADLLASLHDILLLFFKQIYRKKKKRKKKKLIALNFIQQKYIEIRAAIQFLFLHLLLLSEIFLLVSWALHVQREKNMKYV